MGVALHPVFGCLVQAEALTDSGAVYKLFMGSPHVSSHNWAVEAVLISRGTHGGCCLHPRWLPCMWDWALFVCLWHRVVSEWSLRSRSTICLGAFGQMAICVLCATLHLCCSQCCWTSGAPTKGVL